MKLLARRGVIRGTGAALALSPLAMPLVSRFAHAAETTWRLGHVAPKNTPLHQNLLEAADAIAKRSDGKMEVKIAGAGEAGIPSGLLAQVRGGGLEMSVATGMQLASAAPSSSIPLIGFLFTDYKAVWPAMDGEFGQYIRTQMATELGVQVLDKMWDFGFRHISTREQPIRTASDVSGLKIRTQADSDQMDIFRGLNAVPVVITLPYLRMALEHRQVDGQDGLIPVISYARLSEVLRHCALTYHAWDGLSVCVNTAAWKKLPERLQRIVTNTFNTAASRQRDANVQMEKTVRDALSQAGMTFTEVDKASFRDLLRRQGYYAGIRTKLGDPTWNIVQKASGVTA